MSKAFFYNVVLRRKCNMSELSATPRVRICGGARFSIWFGITFKVHIIIYYGSILYLHLLNYTQRENLSFSNQEPLPLIHQCRGFIVPYMLTLSST